jgi:hypothetical protein
MNTENPKSSGAESPQKQSLDGTKEEEEQMNGGSLFHAYALKVGRGAGIFAQLMENGRLTELRRVTTPTPRPTFLHSPQLPSARNGGHSYSANILMRHARVLSCLS